MSDHAGQVRERIDAFLAHFLSQRVAEVVALDAGLVDLVAAIDDYVSGGKRIRPMFCYWGWRAAGGDPAEPEIIHAASALELLHTSALVHDDVMDNSDLRRGRPAAHRRFATMHADRAWQGAADDFGTGAAILLGDLCLGWSEEALSTCRLPADDLARGVAVYDRTRTEVIAGQYLDLAGQSARTSSVAAALHVVELKSARYSVQRPLELGATLAGGGADLVAALAAYGLPVGIAFQLRDDLLGVFGDPATTGKPVGDDVREGKRTVLLACGYEMAGPAGVALLDRLVGDPTLDPSGVAAVQELLLSCGAYRRVESMIDERADHALEVLRDAPIADRAVSEALVELTSAVTVRQV